MKGIEYRMTQSEMEASRADAKISGYGIVFNSDSLPMQMYENGRIVEVVERIKPESLKDCDMRDIICAYNHNFEKVMGRTTSGTMKISRDQRGIRYTVQTPETTYANDVIELIQRGDVRGSSFVFTMDYEEGYDIKQREDGKLEATPKKITKIYEMGPVITPAYPETTAENRSSLLEQAVKRFLNEKDAAEQRNEAPDGEDKQQRTEQPDPGPDTADDSDVNGTGADAGQQEQRSEPITYPFPKGYYSAKAKSKRRV